jgi:hypothetical protein
MYNMIATETYSGLSKGLVVKDPAKWQKHTTAGIRQWSPT